MTADVEEFSARSVRACARTCTMRVTPRREECSSLWKTCGQDDGLADRISIASEKQYWRGLDRSPSPPPWVTRLTDALPKVDRSPSPPPWVTRLTDALPKVPSEARSRAA